MKSGCLISANYDRQRLTQEDIASYGQIGYSYDKAGNRTGYFGPQRYGYYYFNQANQLTEAWENEAQFLYLYDASGSLTEKQTPEGLQTYTYDGLGRLKTETVGGVTAAFTYDAMGRRDSRVESGNERNIHYFQKTDLADFKTKLAIPLSCAFNKNRP